MKNIEAFISREIEYFAPMQRRALQSTPEEREEWRKETIRERQERISLEVFDLLDGIVKYGPFTGLKLDKNTWWGRLDLGSQCLGLYEKELLNQIESIDLKKYQTFIDIGAADGYYAIGMLASKRVKKTICFEQSPKGQKAIASNWEKNGSIGELVIYGEATTQTLATIMPSELKNALVLIDIEGGEFDLLSHEMLKTLSSCLVFIEIHNWVDDFSKKYKTLLENANEFFEIDIVSHQDRKTCHLEELRDFTDDNRLLLTSERRPCLMRFLKLTPRSE